MPKHVAFLRAINVGGHTVKMDQLRRIFSALGFTNVETFIASGNVIFESPAKAGRALEARIEAELLKRLGYAVETFVRSPAALAGILDHSADLAAEGHALFIGFLGGAPAADRARAIMACATEFDAFHVHGQELYWLLRGRFSDSKFTGARLEKMLGMPTTLRSVTTVRKLAAIHAGDRPAAAARRPASRPTGPASTTKPRSATRRTR